MRRVGRRKSEMRVVTKKYWVYCVEYGKTEYEPDGYDMRSFNKMKLYDMWPDINGFDSEEEVIEFLRNHGDEERNYIIVPEIIIKKVE